MVGGWGGRLSARHGMVDAHELERDELLLLQPLHCFGEPPPDLRGVVQNQSIYRYCMESHRRTCGVGRRESGV